MEVRVKPQLETEIAEIAAARDTSIEDVVNEYIENCIAYDRWFRAEVKKGIDAADRGELVDHSEIEQRFRSRFPRS